MPRLARPPEETALASLRAAVHPNHVDLLPGLEAPGDPSIRHRRTTGSIARQLRHSLLEQLDNVDWLWVAYPPLVADSLLLKEFKSRRIRVSWDWDCLSLLHLRFARRRWAAPHSVVEYGRAVSAASYEYRSLRKLQAITVPGKTDRLALERTTRRRVMQLSAVVDVNRFAAVARSRTDDGPVAVFIGSCWQPNIHGISWVLRNVWPQVMACLPQARLRIVGRGLTRELLGDPGRGVEIIGEVQDVRTELARARVVLCPIFFGAGIPTKLLEAAASGKATLATTYCHKVLGGSPFEISDAPAHWQKQLVRLLRDQDAALELGDKVLAYVKAEWSELRWRDEMMKLEMAMSSV